MLSEVTVTAIALGERFNEPWPITPGPGMRHDARAFPSDQVSLRQGTGGDVKDGSGSWWVAGQNLKPWDQ